MPSLLHESFESVPELQKLTPEERNQVSDVLYTRMLSDPKATRGELRAFRDMQAEQIYDQEVQAGKAKGLDYGTWKRLMTDTEMQDTLYNAPEALGKVYRPEENVKALFKQVNDRNEAEWWKDLGAAAKEDVTTDRLLVTIPKMAADLAGTIGSGILAAGKLGSGFSLRPDKEGNLKTPSFFEEFGKNFESFSNLGPMKKLNEAYEKRIEQDPEMFRALDWAATDGLVALATGGIAAGPALTARATAGAAKVGLDMSKIAISRLQRAQIFASHQVSQAATSFTMYQTMNGLEKAIEASDMDDASKTGLLLTVMLPLGHLIGSGFGYVGGRALANPAYRAINEKIYEAGRLERLPRLQEEYIQKQDFRNVISDNLFDLIEERQITTPAQSSTTPPTQPLAEARPLTNSIKIIDSMLARNDLDPIIRQSLENSRKQLELGIPVERGIIDDAILAKDKLIAGQPLTPDERAIIRAQIRPSTTGTIPDTSLFKSYSPESIKDIESLLNRDERNWISKKLNTAEYKNQQKLDIELGNAPNTIIEHMKTREKKLTELIKERRKEIRRQRVDEEKRKYQNYIEQIASGLIQLDTKKSTLQESNRLKSKAKLAAERKRRKKEKKAKAKNKAEEKKKSTTIEEILEGKKAEEAQDTKKPTEEKFLVEEEPPIEESERLEEDDFFNTLEGKPRDEEYLEENFDRDLPTFLDEDVEYEAFLGAMTEEEKTIWESRDNQPTSSGILREGPATAQGALDSGNTELADNTKKTLALNAAGVKSIVDKIDSELASTEARLKEIESRWNREVPNVHAQFQKELEEIAKRRGQLISNKLSMEDFQIGTKPEDAPQNIRIEDLSPAQQLRFAQLADYVNEGKEQLIGRPLTDAERLETNKQLLAKPSAWSGRVFDYSDKPIVSKFSDKINAGYIESNYSKLFNPLVEFITKRAKGIEEITNQQINLDTLIAFQQSLMDGSGLYGTPERWASVRPVLEEAFKLYDEIKDSINYQKAGITLKSYLRKFGSQLGITQRQGNKIADVLTSFLPNLNIGFMADSALGNRILGAANYLTRVVSIGLEAKDIRTLSHELGHMHFMFGLDAAQKMEWLDRVQNFIGSEAAWAKEFPGFTEKMQNLKLWQESGNATDFSIDRELISLHNPAEMYAAQFSALLLDNVIPKADQMSQFGRISESFRRAIGWSTENFERLSPDTQNFFFKVFAMPNLKDVSKIPAENVRSFVQNHPLFLSEEEAKAKIGRIDADINLKYGYLDNIIGTADDKVEPVQPQDLPNFIYSNALKLLYEDNPAAAELMTAASKRAEAVFNSPKEVLRTISGRVMSIYPVNGPEAIKEWKSWIGKDQELRERISHENFLQVAKAIDEGAPEPILGNVKSLADARQVATYELAKAYSEYASTKDFALGVMGEKGLIDIVDSPVNNQLSRADNFSVIPSYMRQFGARDFAVHTFSEFLKGSIFAYMGFEDDPDGYFSLPGLGRFNWNPSRYLDCPFALFLLPGFKQGVKGLGFLGKKAGSKLFTYMPREAQDKAKSLYERTREVVLDWTRPYEGLTKEFGEMSQTAKNKAAIMTRDLAAFSDMLYYNYSPEDRLIMSRWYDKGRSFVDHYSRTLKNKRDLMAAVKVALNLSEDIQRNLRYFGVIDQPKNLPHYYKALQGNTSNIKKLILKDPPTPKIKLKVYTGQNVYKKLNKSVSDNLQLAGATVNTLVNSYLDGHGKEVFAIVGTPYDDMLKTSVGVKPLHVWGGKDKGYTVNSLDNKNVSIIRDFTREEGKALDDIEDLSLRLVSFANGIQRDYSRAILYDSIARSKSSVKPFQSFTTIKEDGVDLSFKTPQEMMQYVKDSPRWEQVKADYDPKLGIDKYGNLSGAWIERDAAKALKAFHNNSVMWGEGLGGKVIRGLISGWKASKTVVSLPTHINNFVSNIIMGGLLGHNPFAELKEGWNLLQLRRMDNRVRQLSREGKIVESFDLKKKLEADPDYQYYKMTVEHGLGESSMWGAELKAKESIDELLDAYAKRGGNINNAPANGSWLAKGVGAAVDWGKKGFRLAGGLYEAEDLIFKYGAFKRGIQKGMKPQEALSNAYEAYFDYGNISRSAKWLRDTGIVPFITYMYKATPALFKVLYNNPVRFAIAMAALESVNLAGLAYDYGADNLLEKKRADENLRPEYLKGNAFGGLLNVFPHTSGGILDMSRKVPMGDFLMDGSNVREDKTYASQLLHTFFTSNPIMSTGLLAVSNFDISFGRSILSGSGLDDPAVLGRHRGELFKKIANSFLPNWPFLPYTYSHDSMMNGLVAAGVLPQDFNDGMPFTKDYTGVDSMGLPTSGTSMFFGQLGWKYKQTDPLLTYSANKKHTDFELNKEKGLMNKKLKNPNYSNREKLEAIEEFKEIARRTAEKQQQLAKDASVLLKAQRRQQDDTALPR